MSRPRKTRTPTCTPDEILSQDGIQKAVLTPHQNILVADYYRFVGRMSGSGSWRWDRRAVVRMQPLEAALAVIQRITDTPFPKRR